LSKVGVGRELAPAAERRKFIFAEECDFMDVFIKTIHLNDNGTLFVYPDSYAFDMVFRIAMGVNWDEEKSCLIHNPPRNWSLLRWYKQIILAVESEYKITLKVDSDTIYENIDSDMQRNIENGEFMHAV